jgi:DNA polymerase (family X)
LTGSLTKFLKEIKSVKKVTVAGSYRRRKETVGDLDIIAVSNEGKSVSEAFANYESVDEVLSKGETKASIRLKSGLQVDLRIVENESYGAALLYFTGSKEHNIHLRKIANDNGFSVNEYGVFKEDQYILGQNEEDIYNHFDMAYIEPELRKDTGEIEAALNKSLPKLVSLKDIRGDLQMHTVKSDGEQTLSEMAQAAEEIGYEYIAITDHTSYIGVTQGLSEENISAYLQEIEDFNSQNRGVHILKGIEVDIYEDGRLDLPNEALKEMDIVLGSVHSYFNLSKTEQTERLIRAMDNPYFNILAHPTTRRIGSRDPIDFDMERIMKAALERGCYLEINANPERLDIWDRHIRLAGELGLKLAISTDAHRQTGLANMKFGIYQARRGWAEKSQILNTRSSSELLSLLKRT